VNPRVVALREINTVSAAASAWSLPSVGSRIVSNIVPVYAGRRKIPAETTGSGVGCGFEDRDSNER